MTGRPPPRTDGAPEGRYPDKAGGHRQVGARLTADLYHRLREHALLTNRSYPAILARAYEAYHGHLGPPPGGSFGYREPTRLGKDSRLVQFYLEGSQISLLQALAADTGRSVAGTIRYLLARYLTSSPVYEEQESPPSFLCVTDLEWADLLKRTGQSEEIATVQEETGQAKIYRASDLTFRVLDYTMRSGRGKLLSQDEVINLLSSATEFTSPSGSPQAALESLLS